MDDSITGTEVAGYRIQEILGRGGMGVVYKAEDVALSRDVALKRIDPSLANDEAFLRRFRSEAQALARIDSPYIVSVHALRKTEIGLLIVMEYVEGGTLKDLIRKGPADWQEALPIIKQMLIALEHAHGTEVIHRDIKPQNVMLGAEGTVKVTDFGLAKVHRPDSDRTVTQGVFGTLDYMSPEQVQGSADLDHRSDLYSLGMTVYEILAGDLPFDEDSNEFAKMRRIVEEKLPPPNELCPQVPDDLSALVMRALEKNPDDRFQSAESMREAFETFEETRSAEKVQTSPPTTHEETASSSIGQWPMGIGLAILLLLIAGGGYWLAESGGSPPSSETRLSISTQPPGAAVSIEGDRVGTTPLPDTIIEGRRVRVRATLAGYEPVDTALQLEDHQEVDLQFPFSRETTLLSVRSEPAGRVSLGKEVVGRTPLSREFKTDTVRVRVEREGYLPVDTLVALTQTDQARLRLQLEQKESEPDPQRRGTLRLRAVPKGTVYLDEQRRSSGQSIRVMAEEAHQIRIKHPQNGVCDTTLKVEEGEEEVLTCHFEHRVVVQSTPWARVFINGENTGQPTTHDTTLGTGQAHRIGARIQSRPYTVTGGEYLRRWEERDRIAGPKEFRGRSTTVPMQPAFGQKTHVIDFQASESEP